MASDGQGDVVDGRGAVMPKVNRPRLVNRGPAGLLRKVESSEPESGWEEPSFVAKIDVIADGLQHLAVPVDDLMLDPDNARVHPERNMEAIKLSLSLHGQLRAAVRNPRTGFLMSGNGMVRAMRDLGWTMCAVLDEGMSEGEAASYSLADNRTAELASWNLKTVARLEALSREANIPVIGWTKDELMALRLEIAEDDDVPDEFPEVTEDIAIDHVCPRCGYAFSGGKTVAKVDETEGDDCAEGDPSEEG
jgi:hypothetical protein